MRQPHNSLPTVLNSPDPRSSLSHIRCIPSCPFSSYDNQRPSGLCVIEKNWNDGISLYPMSVFNFEHTRWRMFGYQANYVLIRVLWKLQWTWKLLEIYVTKTFCVFNKTELQSFKIAFLMNCSSINENQNFRLFEILLIGNQLHTEKIIMKTRNLKFRYDNSDHYKESFTHFLDCEISIFRKKCFNNNNESCHYFNGWRTWKNSIYSW